jgi:polyisoprenoid-binding protein YceI
MQYFASSLVLALLLSALSPLAAVIPAQAAARAWELDAAHSNVYFAIDHIYAKIRGRFADLSGTIAFDPANLKESRIALTIKVDSIETGIGKRDKHLRSPDFFDSGTYPTITFVSTAITPADNGTFLVKGELTVKGVPHATTLPLTFSGPKEHPAVAGKQVAGLNGALTVDRLALNVGDGSFYQQGLIGKDVEVLVTLELLAAK